MHIELGIVGAVAAKYDDINIDTTLKHDRLRCLCHVRRMEDGLLTKKNLMFGQKRISQSSGTRILSRESSSGIATSLWETVVDDRILRQSIHSDSERASRKTSLRKAQPVLPRLQAPLCA
ncbi:hypothetical protein DPMN_176381 [Dreissena polymorpha]|uniref:Uncharacterized protein n=1 Tax=Dreissena polymorpha TaxID=45954 RepID=A0A9D4EA04_DREPO|nr:hypothetical protein DPMN_176381 [Dreissena polymorpha]